MTLVSRRFWVPRVVLDQCSGPGRRALVADHQWHPALNLLGMVASGSASWEEVRPILEDRMRERELDRLRLERKRAGPAP